MSDAGVTDPTGAAALTDARFQFGELIIRTMLVDNDASVTGDLATLFTTLTCANDRGRCYSKYYSTLAGNDGCLSYLDYISGHVPQGEDRCAQQIKFAQASAMNLGFAWGVTGDPAVYQEYQTSQPQCAAFMAMSSGSGVTSSSFDAASLASALDDYAAAQAASFGKAINAQIDANVANSVWAKSVGLTLANLNNVTNQQNLINQQVNSSSLVRICSTAIFRRGCT